MKKTFIYGLYSNIDEEIRYIGKSDNPDLRLKRHIYQRNDSNTHKNNWISKIIENNGQIYYKIIEEVDYDIWKEREIFWISKYKNLVNTSKGGEGGRGNVYNISYSECKDWILKNLNIKSKKQWILYSKNLPSNIPKDPRQHFKNKGWISWGDFLSTNRIQDNKLYKYLSYDDAKKWIIENLNIKLTSKIWKDNNFCDFIPNRPERYYKNKGWVSWSDFLSNNNNIQNQKKEYLNYTEFINFFIKNKIKVKNKEDWNSFKNKKPIFIYSRPDIYYKNFGWVSWSDFYKKVSDYSEKS